MAWNDWIDPEKTGNDQKLPKITKNYQNDQNDLKWPLNDSIMTYFHPKSDI